MPIIKKILSTSIYGSYCKLSNLYRDYQRKVLRTKGICDYIDQNAVRKLQIGSGSNVLQGWMNTDLNEHELVLFMDAGKLFPIPSNTFDYVYSEHIFEHLTLEQQLNMIKESYRVLKPGGIMRIATPSIDFLYGLYREPNSHKSIQYADWAINNIPQLRSVGFEVADKNHYHIYVINNFFKAWGHQLIHNPESLTALAIQCGFNQATQCAVGKSDEEALQNIEKHGTIIPAEINIIETMVLEFKK